MGFRRWLHRGTRGVEDLAIGAEEHSVNPRGPIPGKTQTDGA